MGSDEEEVAKSQRKIQPVPAGPKVPRGRERKNSAAVRGPSARRGEVRDRIKVAARRDFIDSGYDDVALSQIAEKAGCTSAMISYYFGSKQALFRECFNLPQDPSALIIEALKGDIQGAGERVARRALQLYEDELTADTMRVLMRALVTDTETNQRFREYIRTEVLSKVTGSLGAGHKFAEEIEFAIATMFGVVTMRYVVKLEPMASMPREALVKQLAPVIQHRIDRATRRQLQLRGSRGNH